MPPLGPQTVEDSLFSLELVVEKVYVPHTPCRFPAIAFRLLDYPTIVIKHVEDDLGKAIRSKISFDPYYQLPDQFSELKDKHGNFMIKKGKSCLFKISADVLKQHLANTPLYVMVIDLFPEVPKLVGNSTVPLNSLMDSICVDIAKLGSTVPSVHGDKGLFKLYNLMGKEIGYFVLGFRLLCLGPGLIPHLPESALVQRGVKGKKAREERRVDDMIQAHQNQLENESESEESVVELRSSACMTDPVKHDVLLQTVEMEDKAIHVAVSDSDKHAQIQTKAVPEKDFQSMSTQTDKRKRVKEAQNVKQKWVEQVEHKIDDDDIIINNIVCPPPLFYNSEARPDIKINRHHSISVESDMSCEDLSEITSYDGHGLEKEKPIKKDDFHNDAVELPQAIHIQPQAVSRSNLSPQHIPQARRGETVHGLQVAPQSDAIFPLLTALINELSCIQNPQLLLQVSNRMQAASAKSQGIAQPVQEKILKEPSPEEAKLSPSVVATVAAALTRKLENSKENISVTKPSKPARPQSAKTRDAKASQNVHHAGGQSPQRPSKKSKLVFGLTNTQRLRLQKTNPQWLKSAENEAAQQKSKKQPTLKPSEVIDMNATTFSDTLTEVRRLAEKEMNSTAGGDTLRQVASEVEMLESTGEGVNTRKSPLRPQRSSSALSTSQKSKRSNAVGRSPPRRSLRKTPSPKARSRLRHRRSSQQRELLGDSSDSDDVQRKRPVPHERHRTITKSPADQDQNAIGYEDQLSPRSDLPSSRSRSIEVRVPSVEPDVDDSATITDAEDNDKDVDVEDDDNVDIPLPDDSMKEKGGSDILNFPKYISKDSSLPETIHGMANGSLNMSGVLDDNSPLESTRHSKNMTSDQNDSKILQSTDYDTRQFQSTDEPELQELISEEENPSDGVNSGRRSVASVRTSQKFPVINPQMSENSPVPSVRRSTTKLDPTTQSYLPSMSLSKGQGSPVSSRPSTPKGSNYPPGNEVKMQPLNQKSGSLVASNSKSNITPRSTSSSPRRPMPRPRKPLRESIHTDSLSSYMPSDPENVVVSLSSNSGNYSDDFMPLGSGESAENSVEFPRIIPSAKLGYTIN